MKKILKIVLWTILALVVLAGGALGLFIYKVKNGFPVSYETDAPNITFPDNQPAILLFSKTTGFRHGESIDASKPVFADLAKKNNWFLYETESGGVFNTPQLSKFSAVVFNNSTGEVINDTQKRALEDYVKNGGTLIGIHGAGDDSHHWDWYEHNLLGAKFSHHPIKQQFQEATVTLQTVSDTILGSQLPPQYKHTDEWYVFFENPKNKGFKIIYNINGDEISPDGNMLWMKDKNFGMGKDHPVAWYNTIEKGKTFYTSIGHDSRAWKNENVVKLIENALNWGIKK
ncbi:MAG: ThuA domain-containing protein [Saprospiraceae bacterium]|nr:ThuA domain-containing protein [Saprospiraceae bacterium]